MKSIEFYRSVVVAVMKVAVMGLVNSMVENPNTLKII